MENINSNENSKPSSIRHDAPDFQSGRSVTLGGYRKYTAVGVVRSVFAVLRGWGTSKYSVYPIMFRISENL